MMGSARRVATGSMGARGGARRTRIGAAFAAVAVAAGLAAPAAASPADTWSTGAVSSVRVAGDDRYLTAIEVARLVGGGSLTGLDRLIVVTGEAFPDALVASGLAGHLDRCGSDLCGRTAILLTRQASLPAEVAAAIAESGVAATEILVVGGPSAVSDPVHAAIARAAGWNGAGMNPVPRIFGQTRYETSVAVLDYVRTLGGASLPSSYRTVLVANGENFPDALAGGALAYRNGHLTVLSRPRSAPDTTLRGIDDLDATCAILLGGPAALTPVVGTQVDEALEVGGCGTDRVGGDDRYETAALVADRMKSTNGPARRVALVSGVAFPDALVAAPLAANNTPILFSAPSQLPVVTANWLAANTGSLNQIAAIGGTSTVPPAVVNAAVTAATPLPMPPPAPGGGGGSGGDPGAWPVTVGASSTDTGYAISALADGSAIVTGEFTGSAGFGTTTLTSTLDGSTETTDAFVAKIGADGDWDWAISAGAGNTERGYGVSTLSDGSAMVVGGFFDGITFAGPNTVSGSAITLGDENNSNALGREIFVAKVNAVGKWEWAVHVGDDGNDEVGDVAVLADGSAIVTGMTAGTNTAFGSTVLTGSGDAFVAKIDANGNWVWASSAGNPVLNKDVTGNDVAVLADGSAIVTGTFTGTTTFTPTASASVELTSAAGIESSDAFVAKISATGEWEWAARAGGAVDYESDIGRGVAVLADGSAIVAGRYVETANFTPAAGGASISLTAPGGTETDDVFVARISATGEWLWAVRGGGDDDGAATSVATLPDGSGVIVTGEYSGADVEFGTATLPDADSDYVFVAKITTAGQWDWAVGAGSADGTMSGRAVAVFSSGASIVTGTIEGPAVFGTVSRASTDESEDVFVARVTAGGSFGAG